MTDEEIASRLRPIKAIATLEDEVENEVVAVGDDSITLMSSRSKTGQERTIPFDHIRKRNTSHGCIIDALRQVLGITGQ